MSYTLKTKEDKLKLLKRIAAADSAALNDLFPYSCISLYYDKNTPIDKVFLCKERSRDNVRQGEFIDFDMAAKLANRPNAHTFLHIMKLLNEEESAMMEEFDNKLNNPHGRIIKWFIQPGNEPLEDEDD